MPATRKFLTDKTNDMNRNVNSSIILMDAGELEQLTTEVKETIAENAVVKKSEKQFDAANLWNIQRNRKTQSLSKRPVLSRRTTIV